jgi:hypothetical protein
LRESELTPVTVTYPSPDRACGALLPQTPKPIENPKVWRELAFKVAEQRVQHREEQEQDQRPHGVNGTATVFSAVLSLVPLRLNHALIFPKHFEKLNS